ncbi:MAG: bis(5'-nucleosyl)-tetraphosphatase (symmetrical) YqeK [Candidatus Atribacteria bacterium]|nr:bis(5'-nucleosyl)-tetraphosphatase (symmetrical) YqeK [Candidatus Atribacteria bacterium]
MPVINSIIEWLEQTLTPHRYDHSFGVAEESRKIAELFHSDSEKAYLTGLIHDSARTQPAEVLRSCLPSFFLPVGSLIPEIFHAFAGPYFIMEKFGITDYSVLHAVCWHATACADMTDFDKILFIADMTEPGRTFPDAKVLRESLLLGLSRTYVKALECKLRYLFRSQKIIYPSSLDAWNKEVTRMSEGCY